MTHVKDGQKPPAHRKPSKVHVLDHRRGKVWLWGYRKKRLRNILHKILEMRELRERWVSPVWTDSIRIRFCAAICLHGWDMGPPLHARDERAVQAMGERRWFSAKESEVDRICRKDHGHLKKCRTTTGEYYFNLLHQLDAKIHEKMPGLKKKKSSFRTTYLHASVR